MIISHHRRRKKEEGEYDEWVFHKVSYKWIRKTKVIPELGFNYNVWGYLRYCGIF